MTARRRGTLLALVLGYLAFEIVGFDWLNSIPTVASLVDQAPPLSVSLLQVVVFFAVVYRVTPDRLRAVLDVPDNRRIGLAALGFASVLVVEVVYLNLVGLAGMEVTGSSTEIPSMSGPMFVYFALGLFFTVGLLEEYAFREILQQDVLQVVSANAAVRVAVTSVLFAAVHLPFYAFSAGGVLGVGGIFLFSLIVGYLYERTGNLVIPVLVHWWWDVFVVGLSAL